jgi:glycosyltransferase involved in cell wall biosynthesis
MTRQPGAMVSVIIPACNAAETIGPTVESVRAQTYGELEILVADDGSTDDTPAIVRELAARDPRIRLIEGPHCGHPGAVRNRALREARADYIAFLDADDCWIAGKIEAQLARLRAMPGANLSFTPVRALPVGTLAPLDHPPPPSLAAPDFLIPEHSGWKGFEDLLIRRRSIHMSSVLLSRELADAIGPFSEAPGLIRHQNNDYVLRAWRAGCPAGLPEIMVIVYRRPASASTSSTWVHSFAVLEEVERRESLPRRLRRRAWSVAWIVRAERALASGDASWRRSMLRAWSLDPFSIRRWPALISAALPASLARRFYDRLRRWRTASTPWPGASKF